MSSLEPELALAYVRELSADLRAGIVLDADGQRLAGDGALETPARALLRSRPHARELHGTAQTAAGVAHVFAVRAGQHPSGAAPGRALVVVTGPHALPRLILRDMRTVLAVDTPRSGQETSPETPDPVLVEALATAAADAFRP